MKARIFVIVATLLAIGCGNEPPPAAASASPSPPASGDACRTLAHRCHAHDKEGSVHDCHHLGHSAPSESACAAKLNECLAACPEGDAG